MCHGAIDPKFLMQDAEVRLRQAGAVRVADGASDGELPRELMGGLHGVRARLVRLFAKPARAHPAE